MEMWGVRDFCLTWLVWCSGQLLVGLLLFSWWFSRNLPTAVQKPNEKKFLDPLSGKEFDFPSLFDPPTKELSVIVPAYNEQDRLPMCLDEMLKWLVREQQTRTGFTFEIIVVDDGSRDATAEITYKYVRRFGSDAIRVLHVRPNGGKGNAVKKGALVARGRYIMFADADGASLFDDTAALFEALRAVERNGFGVAVGSRNHLVRKAIATRKWYRNLLMHGFHALVWLLAVRTVRDTQCGFKLFSRAAAQVLFPSQHLSRWGFDVELLHIAERLRIPIAEVAVNWTEVPGSKLNIVGATLSIAKDLLLVFVNYTLGRWRVSVPPAMRSMLPLPRAS